VLSTAWRELLLYLLGGFGTFLVGSLLLSRFIGHITILASLALYLLNFMCFAGAAYFLGVRRQNLTWAEFGLRPFGWQWLALALGLALAILPLRAAAAFVVQMLLGGGLDQMKSRMEIVAPAGSLGINMVLTLIGAGLLAPVAEELYFRGLLHRWCWARFPNRTWLRVLLSSTFFALGHIDSLGVVASTFFLGVLCALAYERSRSLWLSIAIHIVNNSLAVVLLYAALALQAR
jgi:membrane protease YdiL (CAAX protease family)